MTIASKLNFTAFACILLIGSVLLFRYMSANEPHELLPREKNSNANMGPGIDGVGDFPLPDQAADSGSRESISSDDNSIMEARATGAFPQHVTKFLGPPGQSVFLESYIRERLSEADLPFLYRALPDESFAGQWGDIIFAICVLEEDRKALQVVKDFVSTPWDWQSGRFNESTARPAIRRIMRSIQNLAMLDPAVSGPFLQDTFTREGAMVFLNKWRGAPLPAGMKVEDTLVNDVRYSAAAGLLHTRSPELFQVVEDTFYQLARVPPSERLEDAYTMEICKLHLGERDLYNKMGWEEGIAYIYSLEGDAAIYNAVELMGKYTQLELKLSGSKK